MLKIKTQLKTFSVNNFDNKTFFQVITEKLNHIFY